MWDSLDLLICVVNPLVKDFDVSRNLRIPSPEAKG